MPSFPTIFSADQTWKEQVIAALVDLQISTEVLLHEGHYLLKVKDLQLILHLVEINHHDKPEQLLSLQLHYAAQGIKLIHLWEDVWQNKTNQVLFRLKSLMGLNQRIHGRKTQVERIDKARADEFLALYHLQGSVASRYKLGLFLDGELMAVATFSALRTMRFQEGYRSAELIRFAVKGNFSIVGGLSKLIAYFNISLKPDDLMTYAHRDWSDGESYEKLGFEHTAILPPRYFDLNPDGKRKLSNASSGHQVFNTGSLKFILKFSYGQV